MSDVVADCVFCKIIEGEIPALRVYEDERALGFWDANPVAALHILVVPRKHISTLNDIGPDDDILAHMGRVAVKIAEQFRVAQSGYRIFVNVNRGGGQVMFHLHMHVISKTNSWKG
jgi:histidine triad (HIT) family protein